MTELHPAQRLVELLGIRYPIVQGGMTFGSDGRLVAAVSEAGGLGTLGTFHYRTFEKVMEQVAVIRAGTTKPFAVNVPFFENNYELVERLVLEGGVTCFTLGGWFSEQVAALKEAHGLTILVSVNSPTVARMVEERPLDVLIVQGNESGGANSHFTTRQLYELIQPTIPSVPVLLAGGQWDGLDLQRALLLGAAGVQLGTRFFFCSDSPLHMSIKTKVASSNRPTTTTLVPVSETLNMRFITNKPFKAANKSGRIQEIFQDKEQVYSLSEVFYDEHKKPPLLYAGTGIHKLREIQTAAEVIDDVISGYERLQQTDLPAFG